MRHLTIMLAALAAILLSAAPAYADFGLSDLDVSFENEEGGAELRAGAHPFALTTEVDVETVAI